MNKLKNKHFSQPFFHFFSFLLMLTYTLSIHYHILQPKPVRSPARGRPLSEVPSAVWGSSRVYTHAVKRPHTLLPASPICSEGRLLGCVELSLRGRLQSACSDVVSGNYIVKHLLKPSPYGVSARRHLHVFDTCTGHYCRASI